VTRTVLSASSWPSSLPMRGMPLSTYLTDRSVETVTLPHYWGQPPAGRPGERVIRIALKKTRGGRWTALLHQGGPPPGCTV
jgi:hypothetical protein